MASAIEPCVGELATETGGAGLGSVSRLHVMAVLICATGFAIDLSEFAVGNALSAIYSSGPHALSAGTLSWLLCSVYVGAAVGAPLLGKLGDRLGMRRTMVLVLFVLAFATLSGAASSTIMQLTIARFVAGMALGGYPPLMIAYLTDIAPKGRRGMMVLWTCSVAYLGPPAMLFAIRYLTSVEPLGVDGWRWGLTAAGVLALLASQALRWIPEGPGWLLANGRGAEAASATERFTFGVGAGRPQAGRRNPPLHTSSRHARTMSGLANPSSHRLPARITVYALSYALIAVATVAFPLLTGPVLLARGISLTDTLFYVALGSLGPVVATLACSPYIDRIPKRTALILCASFMVASVVVFFASHDGRGLILSVMVFGMCMALYLPTIAAHGAEIFPMGVRAAATSAGWASNRLGAALAPLVLLPLVRGGRTELVEVILCISLLATIALLLLQPMRVAANGEVRTST